MSRFAIIDGNAIVHRAYHAIPPLTTKEGLMVNAVYGFASMLLKVWHDVKPTHLAVSFDVPGGTFRHAKYEKYKATRVKADQELYDQIPLAHEVAKVFNIPVYEMPGYEADDVIGTLARQAKELVDEVYIVTGDMDAIQLVDEKIKVYTLRKGMSDIVIYDTPEVIKRYGFTPKQMIDYKSLRGDTSDNIPGVTGIGEVTATELITKIGGLEDIYNKIGQLKELGIKDGVIKKLTQFKDQAYMSYDLATIDQSVPGVQFSLKDCEVSPLDHDRISDLFKKYEFVSLLKRLPGVESLKNEGEKKENKILGKRKLVFKEIKSVEEVKELVKKISNVRSFAAKEVFQGTDVFTGEFSGLSIVVNGEAYSLAIKYLENIKEIFVDSSLELVGHDLKQLIKLLSLQNIQVNNRLFDTMVASYLIQPGSRAHDIAGVILKVLGEESKVGAGQDNLFGVDKPAQAEELGKLVRAAEILKRELVDTNNLGLMEKIEMPLVASLADMELNGVAVDQKLLHTLSQQVKEEIDKLSVKIYGLAGVKFNIASPIQLREVLFDKLNISVTGIKKGKTGLSTSAEQLEKMRDMHPIIVEIENYRELAKLQNTYIDVLPKLINPKTKRIHTTFNQAVTATGRLSSSDPNLQNIPIRTELGREVRKAFVAEPGHVLVSADYSQIELRIVASLAEDKKMLEIFTKDEDIHRATAAAINQVPLDQVTKEMRRAAKEINFGVLYGMGSYGLSWRAEIPQKQAKEFIEKYFREFSGVREYIDRTLAFTKKEGYAETLFGRRRYLPELNSHNYQVKSTAERMAINHPIQGTAADLIKMAMVAITQKINAGEAGGNKESVRPILQVHDELVFEVDKRVEEKFVPVLKETMENVVTLRVPIRVEVNIGHSWGEMK